MLGSSVFKFGRLIGVTGVWILLIFRSSQRSWSQWPFMQTISWCLMFWNLVGWLVMISLWSLLFLRSKIKVTSYLYCKNLFNQSVQNERSYWLWIARLVGWLVRTRIIHLLSFSSTGERSMSYHVIHLGSVQYSCLCNMHSDWPLSKGHTCLHFLSN